MDSYLLLLLLSLFQALAFCSPSLLLTPLKTNGAQIVNRNGAKVKLQCASYTAHQEYMLPEGLDLQPIESIAVLAKQIGLNCIRLEVGIE